MFLKCCALLRHFPASKNRGSLPCLYTACPWGTQSCVLRVAVSQYIFAFRTVRGALIPAQTFLLCSSFSSKADGPRSHPFGKLLQPHPGLRVECARWAQSGNSSSLQGLSGLPVLAAYSWAVTHTFSFLCFLSLCDRYSSLSQNNNVSCLRKSLRTSTM